MTTINPSGAGTPGGEGARARRVPELLDLLSRVQAAEFVGFSLTTIDKYRRLDLFAKEIWMGGRPHWTRESLLDWVRKGGVDQKARRRRRRSGGR